MINAQIGKIELREQPTSIQTAATPGSIPKDTGKKSAVLFVPKDKQPEVIMNIRKTENIIRSRAH